jgi:hypothetical protein
MRISTRTPDHQGRLGGGFTKTFEETLTCIYTEKNIIVPLSTVQFGVKGCEVLATTPKL